MRCHGTGKRSFISNNFNHHGGNSDYWTEHLANYLPTDKKYN